MSVGRVGRKWMLPVVGVLLLGLAGYKYACHYHTQVLHLRCSGKNACAASSRLARRIVAELGAHDIELELVAAANSHEICTAVNHHLLDLGVVRGGIRADEFENVRQVASLGVEPLHLLVRGERVAEAPPTIDVLKDSRAYIGEFGTNESELVEDLLRFAGLEAKDAAGRGDYEALYLSERELREQVGRACRATGKERDERLARLPDAVFLGGSLPDPLVDVLTRSAGYGLVPLPFATALHLDQRRDYGPSVDPLENGRVERAVIPAYTYGASPAVPAAACETIGLRLLLVAHKDVPASTIRRLLRALGDGSFREHYPELKVSSSAAEFPMHAGATRYAASRRPLPMHDVVEDATNALSMLGAIAAGGFALWSYYRGLRSVSPQYYFEQVDRIERLVRGVESDDAAPAAPHELLAYLETRLAQLKQSVVEDFARGRLVGDDALLGILTMLADTRHLLAETRQRLCRANESLEGDPLRKVA